MKVVNLDRLKNAVLQAMAYNAIDTNKEFASVLGYTESYFSQVLTGRQPCNSKFIQRLKDKLPNLDVEELYNQDAICVNMPASAPENKQNVTAIELENKMLKQQVDELKQQIIELKDRCNKLFIQNQKLVDKYILNLNNE